MFIYFLFLVFSLFCDRHGRKVLNQIRLISGFNSPKKAQRASKPNTIVTQRSRTQIGPKRTIKKPRKTLSPVSPSTPLASSIFPLPAVSRALANMVSLCNSHFSLFSFWSIFYLFCIVLFNLNVNRFYFCSLSRGTWRSGESLSSTTEKTTAGSSS